MDNRMTEQRNSEQEYADRPNDRKPVRYENGKFFFTREGERRFYFFLTLCMMALGIGFKVGLW